MEDTQGTKIAGDSRPVPDGHGTERVLRVEKLVMKLGGRTVVDGVDFQVESGRIVGLLGPNGAGKTTIFKLIMGIYKPVSGKVWLGRQEMTSRSPHQRARQGLGYLPQGSSAFGGLSVIKNLQAVLELQHRPRSDADAVLESFGLSDLVNQKASTLSGGERRRLELARLLACKPKVVLLDEPFKGLDPIAVEDLTSKIKTLARKNVGVLLTDHAVEQTFSICDHTCIIVDGRRVACGPPSEIMNHPRARESFLGLANT